MGPLIDFLAYWTPDWALRLFPWLWAHHVKEVFAWGVAYGIGPGFVLGVVVTLLVNSLRKRPR